MATFRIDNPGFSARHDVIRLLQADHRRVMQEFREFERLQSLRANQASQRVVQRTLAELKVLAELQQRIFYPAVHEALGGTDLIEQSQIEHTCIRRVVAELEGIDPDDDRYWRRFRTLGEYVRRHVEDEEGELFPMLSCVSIDWESLHRQMIGCRAALAEDLGVLHSPPLRRSVELEPREITDDETSDVALEAQH